MATINSRPVIGDSGSQETEQLRTNYNNLVQVMGDLVTTLKAATVIGDVVTAATTAETALQNTVEKIIAQKDLPMNPLRPILAPGRLTPP